jgi:hypothetical protein
MTVDQIIFQVFLIGKTAHALHEGRDVPSQSLFRLRDLRSRGYVDDPVPKAQVMKHVGDMLILGSGIYIHLDPHFPQMPGQVPDINVHSAGIFATQSCQGAGMIRKHGYAHLRL